MNIITVLKMGLILTDISENVGYIFIFLIVVALISAMIRALVIQYRKTKQRRAARRIFSYCRNTDFDLNE